MAAEGMVHALHTIHGLLKENGRLLDIHPSGEPPILNVRVAEQQFQAGWLRETDDFIEYSQAANAIRQVVKQKRFQVIQRDTFFFETQADSLAELQTFLTENWQDAILEELVARRIEEFMQTIEPDKQILLSEQIHVMVLRPLQQKVIG